MSVRVAGAPDRGADFVAGVCALSGSSMWALTALIVSAVALIVLSFTQTSRRRRIFNAIRLQPSDPHE